MADISSILAQIFSGQQQQLQASNPYLIASSIMPQIAQRKGKGATSSIIANALLGLTKGALAGYGTSDANSQFNDYMSNALPVIENPNAPADSKYSQLQSMLKLNDLMSEAESRRELNKALALNYGASVGPDGTAAPIEGLGQAAGQFENDKFNATYGSPVGSPAQPETESPGGNVISFPGVTSLDAREKEIYKENLRNRMPPTQAAQSARAAVKGERDSMADSFDLAKEASDKGDRMIGIANQAEAALKGVGNTGAWGDLAQKYSEYAAPFSSDQKAKATAGQLLEQMGAETIQMARTKGVGSMSDPEMQLYLKSGFSLGNTPDKNELVLGKIRELGKLQKDYAGFLGSYRRAKGTTEGAEELWQMYKDANQIFETLPSGDIKIRQNRLPWQSFFKRGGPAEQMMMQGQQNASLGAANVVNQSPTPMQQAPMSAGVQQNQAQAPAPQAATAPKYSAQQLQQAGYSAADIAALQQQGMVQ